MVDLRQTGFCLLNVGTCSIGSRPHMRAQILVVLSIYLVLEVLDLRACSPGPFGFGVFLDLFDTMGSIGSILLFCKSGDGGVDALFEGVNIRLDLFNVRCDVCLIVGI